MKGGRISIACFVALLMSAMATTPSLAQRSTPVTVVNPITAPVPVTEVGRFVFIGFSTTTVAGNVGLPMMNQVCQNDFSRSDARMSTTKEYILGTITTFPSEHAWIHPFFFDAGADFSGIRDGAQSLTCGIGWGSVNTSGLAVTASGGIQQLQCGEVLAVSCSATVQ